jgi:hypothetical protein
MIANTGDSSSPSTFLPNGCFDASKASLLRSLLDSALQRCSVSNYPPPNIFNWQQQQPQQNNVSSESSPLNFNSQNMNLQNLLELKSTS